LTMSAMRLQLSIKSREFYLTLFQGDFYGMQK